MMGKSPGKWIKSILLGKKSSKSNLSNSKRNVKEKEVLDSPEVFEISAPVVVPTRNEAVRRHEVVVVEDVSVVRTKEEESERRDVGSGIGEDSERIVRENAAIKAQAAIRGYLARREFRILKGIIRLQAVIRGHLVRRQAVSTLRCVQGVIRFQALVRGQKVRMSAIGIEVQSTCDMGKFVFAKSPDAVVESATTIQEQLMVNDFARKLQSSLSGTTPLCIQYGPGDPNSDWEWVERWTRSKFWESNSQPKNNSDLKSKTQYKHNGRGEAEEHGKGKRGVRKQSSSNVETVSGRATSESDKPKRHMRKSSSHPVDSRQDHIRNQVEKVKGNRRTFDSKKQASERVELDSGEKKVSERRAPGNPASLEQNTSVDGADKKTDTAARVSKQSDVAGVKLTSVSDHSDTLHEHPDFNLQSAEDNGEANDIQEAKVLLNSNGHNIDDENLSTSQRRASFPLNVENVENGVLSTRKVPSYMAPTESARAKLKAQGSPRFSQDEFEKNAVTRRHSLPSSNNGKLTTMSPRVQKLVHSAGKGAIRSDRSLTSSRDGSVSDKLTKPEWRR